MKLFLSVASLALCASSFALSFTGPGILSSAWVEGDPEVDGYNSTTIDISGTGLTVASINSVTLTNFSHTWAGDLEVALYNQENDVFVDLFAPPDARGCNFVGTYTFVVDPAIKTIDQQLVGQTSAYNIPVGTYAIGTYGGGTAVGPRTNYSEFSGLDLDGTWELALFDYASGDIGSLGSWTLNVTPQAVPEPASLAALGLGVAAALRRRKKA